MKPYYEDDAVQIYHADCRELSFEGISAVVTDPPYHLVRISERFGAKDAHNTPAMDTPEGSVWARKARGFMGKEWDGTGVSFQPDTWASIRGWCKSGAMLMAFGGTRTSHRIACAIEDAGWEIRDTIAWVYGSGFPKSLDIGKAVGTSVWEGYGTALKPAYEPITLAMNPIDGTFANNALTHGVAGLNIDGARIPTEDNLNGGGYTPRKRGNAWAETKGMNAEGRCAVTPFVQPKGRFPANFIHDGSQMVMELFPNSKDGVAVGGYRTASSIYGNFMGRKADAPNIGYGSSGSAARFFYCAKASKAERNKGCEELEERQYSHDGRVKPIENACQRNNSVTTNNHPTVKPLALMEYLVKLVMMPEYNLIIDPFCGSGTTLLACIKLGIPCIGIDSDEQSCEIAAKRMAQTVMELGV